VTIARAAVAPSVDDFVTMAPSARVAGSVTKVGGVTDPLKTDEGYEVFRVEARNAGTNAAVFNENQVRGAMTEERVGKEREDYLQRLRNDAYVKIADTYRPSVEPLLKIVPPAAATKRESKKEKGKGKILGIIPRP